MSRPSLFGVFAVVAIVIMALELFVVPKGDATLLVTLTFWTMLAQGCIALAAVGEITKGVWLIPIKRDLLSVYPMLLFLALLYLLLATRMDIYGWSEHPNGWLNVRFFIIRNFVLMLICFWSARALALAVMRDSEKRGTLATVYVALWAITQSMVAFDWIMTLEYPWISTLFGGFFFIQSFLMGLLVSAFIIFFKMRAGVTGLTETLRDVGKMMFSFCFLWGGFFFAQYLVIWYGNLPEEVDYVFKRVDPAPYWGMSRAVLFMIFVIPFVTLVFRKVKVVPPAMISLATLILAGIVLEILVLVTPVVPVSPVWLAAEFVAFIALFALMQRNQDSYMPQEVKAAAGGLEGDLASAHHHQ